MWLADQTKTALAVNTLVVSNTQVSASIQDVLSGEKLKLLYGDPATEIIKWVRMRGGNLLAMSTHGHRLLASRGSLSGPGEAGRGGAAL